MYDERLERLLTQGKTESENIFSQTDYREARSAVHRRIAARADKKAKPLWPFQMKAVFVAVCFIAVVGILSAFIFKVPFSETKTQGDTIAEQKVRLDEGKNAMLSYFPVKAPDNSQPSIMSVLWDTDNSDSQMLYSTVFNSCDVTYPASSLAFPDTGHNLVLIFSGNEQKDFIDYRIIGYNGNGVKEWLSKDFVPDGKLGLEGGLIREQRSAKHEQGTDGTSVTYIIPYDIRVSGELVLPVHDIRLRIGEHILLVGNAQQMLNVSSEKGLFEKVAQNGSNDNNGLEYRATGKGNDVLLLKGNDITGKGLNVNIVE